MKKSLAAESPEAYVRSLTGWQLPVVRKLRKAVLANAALAEGIKWGHLVYASNGPVLLIRAEPNRVLFGFWRGQRLLDMESRLRPSGKYEMATVTLVEGEPFTATQAGKLAAAAIALNRKFGDPTAVTGTK